jgi:hypothetical protein
MLLAIYKTSERATYKQTSKGNATLITQSVTGVAWHLPDENPRIGEVMRRELLMNNSVFLVYSWYIFIVRRLIPFN